MFGAILKATNSSFQAGMTFCYGIYVKKVMKLLAFIFEQPSYKKWDILDMYIMRQSASLAINQNTNYIYGSSLIAQQ